MQRLSEMPSSSYISWRNSKRVSFTLRNKTRISTTQGLICRQIKFKPIWNNFYSGLNYYGYVFWAWIRCCLVSLGSDEDCASSLLANTWLELWSFFFYNYPTTADLHWPHDVTFSVNLGVWGHTNSYGVSINYILPSDPYYPLTSRCILTFKKLLYPIFT